MFGSEFHGYTLWWIFPLLMIILCIFMCVFMMKRRRGAMVWRLCCSSKDSHREDASAGLSRQDAQKELNKEKLQSTTDCQRLGTFFNYKDYRRREMQTEETNDKGEKAKSTAFGFAPMGHVMFEMNNCCTGQNGFSDCASIMNGMMETMRNQPCCTSGKDTQPERRNS